MLSRPELLRPGIKRCARALHVFEVAGALDCGACSSQRASKSASDRGFAHAQDLAQLDSSEVLPVVAFDQDLVLEGQRSKRRGDLAIHSSLERPLRRGRVERLQAHAADVGVVGASSPFSPVGIEAILGDREHEDSKGASLLETFGGFETVEEGSLHQVLGIVALVSKEREEVLEQAFE